MPFGTQSSLRKERESATLTIRYDNAGRRASLTLPNGVVTEYAYDAASQLTGLTYKYGSTILGDLTYGYDAAGRRTIMGGTFARTNLPQSMASATYNDANQLTQKGSVVFSYDANGNLTGDGTNTYAWNARNQLTSISGPSLSASFEYDGLGRRIDKTINSVSTSYLYDGFKVVRELSGTASIADLLVLGLDEVFTRTDGSGAFAHLRDGLGSTLALTNSAGAVQTSYTYEPFGQTSATGSTSSNSSQYAGRENDETGLYYYRARYYSPALQRFISADPIGIAGGINLYAYVDNDPITHTDPFGLDRDTKVRDFVTDKIGGGVTLGGEVVNTTGMSYDSAVNRLKSLGFEPYWDPHWDHWGGRNLGTCSKRQC